jgi:hypothetical protein
VKRINHEIHERRQKRSESEVMDNEGNVEELPPSSALWKRFRLVLSFLFGATIYAYGGYIVAGNWGLAPVWGAVGGAVIGGILGLFMRFPHKQGVAIILGWITCVGAYALVGWFFAAEWAGPTWGVPIWWGLAGGGAFGMLVAAGLWVGLSYVKGARGGFSEREN